MEPELIAPERFIAEGVEAEDLSASSIIRCAFCVIVESNEPLAVGTGCWACAEDEACRSPADAAVTTKIAPARITSRTALDMEPPCRRKPALKARVVRSHDVTAVLAGDS
jgi:hypothetical protein